MHGILELCSQSNNYKAASEAGEFLKYIASRPFSLLLYYIPSPSITEPVVAVSQHIGDHLSLC